MTVHSFRATVASQLYVAGFDDAGVALRIVHRDFRSLKAYQNLQGDVGRQQQVAIFGQGKGSASSVGREHVENEDPATKNSRTKQNKEVNTDEENRSRTTRNHAKRSRLSDALTTIENMSGTITVNIYQGQNDEKDECVC